MEIYTRYPKIQGLVCPDSQEEGFLSPCVVSFVLGDDVMNDPVHFSHLVFITKERILKDEEIQNDAKTSKDIVPILGLSKGNLRDFILVL